MISAELFFGRDIPGRGPLSDAEWDGFAATTITPAFPDGFTIVDGKGQWRDPRSGIAGREAAKVLIVAADDKPDLAGRLRTVIETYKSRFDQQSVGLLTYPACGAF